MPYKVKGNCVYKKEDGSKVGCTKGSVDKYLAALHANANESINESPEVEGGLADDMTAADIAKKFNVSLLKIKKQIDMGIEVELEHTKNRKTAKDIAMDHLSEMPDYYTRLNKMEKEALKYWESKDITENTKDIVYKLVKEHLNNFDSKKKIIQEFTYLKTEQMDSAMS